jgi:hypothetical protein
MKRSKRQNRQMQRPTDERGQNGRAGRCSIELIKEVKTAGPAEVEDE